MLSATANRRRVVAGATILLSLVVVWETASFVPYATKPLRDAWGSSSTATNSDGHRSLSKGTLPHIDEYFGQAFANRHPPRIDYTEIAAACAHSAPIADNLYMQCGGMAAGLTSIVSQVKTCLKMALETGTNFVLPAMPLRDSTNLREFNFLNGDAYLPYDEWFDVEHFTEVMGRACPKMKIVHPKDLEKTVDVRHKYKVDCSGATGYEQFKSLFWAGRPYKHYFNEQMKKQLDETGGKEAGKQGIDVVSVDSQFLLFRITDDPTGSDLRLWNELDRLVRYREAPRQVIERVLDRMAPRPHYGVHFRVENDTMWSSLEHQLGQDLDALDQAWAAQGRPEPRPLVYLACGDAEQMKKFIAAGAERGWEVTHKWKLVEDDAATTAMINNLAFDFMGAVDMGVMVKSAFFIGITGSAFSQTVANVRDPTGRYRGSSFDVAIEGGANNHLFFDLDAREYGCCL